MIGWILRLVVLSMLLTTTTLATPPRAPIAPSVKVHHTALSIDKVCLAWVVDNEARGEPLRGQRAVLDVVEHRMELWNKSACQVVKAPYQFSGYHQGMQLTATKEMLLKLDRVRRIAPVVPNAIGFHNNNVHPAWADRLRKVITINKHAFYSVRTQQKEKQ